MKNFRKKKKLNKWWCQRYITVRQRYTSLPNFRRKLICFVNGFLAFFIFLFWFLKIIFKQINIRSRNLNTVIIVNLLIIFFYYLFVHYLQLTNFNVRAYLMCFNEAKGKRKLMGNKDCSLTVGGFLTLL